MRILVTCPPMLGVKEDFLPGLEAQGYEVICPNVVQTLSVDELKDLVPTCDGWIIGDDPATAEVFEAGAKGRLKAAVKWGIGVDNVDFSACESLGIPITNTPGMFGAEVADLAIGYLIGLARETYFIDRQVRAGQWPKNRGISIAGNTVGVVGLGDIGQNVVTRCQALGLKVIAYDPGYEESPLDGVELRSWPCSLNQCDFLVFTCALNAKNHHMFSSELLSKLKPGLRLINVARGPLLDERAVEIGLKNGTIHSAALDVFEVEPLPKDSALRTHELCIFGSHNASNTAEAVKKTNHAAIKKLVTFLDDEQ